MEEEPFLQPLWDLLRNSELLRPLITHWLFPGVAAMGGFMISCFYFTYLDVTRNVKTKVQKDIWPSNKDMLDAALPQIFMYTLLNGASWFIW